MSSLPLKRDIAVQTVFDAGQGHPTGRNVEPRAEPVEVHELSSRCGRETQRVGLDRVSAALLKVL